MLLATSNSGVRMLTDGSSVATSIVQYSSGAYRVDYFYTEDEMFFRYSSNIFRLVFFYKYCVKYILKP